MSRSLDDHQAAAVAVNLFSDPIKRKAIPIFQKTGSWFELWQSKSWQQCKSASGEPAPTGNDILEQQRMTEGWLRSPHHYLVLYGDPTYPQALTQLTDPPVCLFVKGRWEALEHPHVGIVGARASTNVGEKIAYDLAKALAEYDIGTVSGLALGIDGAAHRGALAGKGVSVAFIGCGLHFLYPQRHETLAQQLMQDGAVVSELPLHYQALPRNFPKRNRLIAALSSGIIVVEAKERSGSLITARLGLELGKEIFAVPGSVFNPLSQGCHRLIQQGATLITRIEDVLEGLPGQVLQERLATLTRGSVPSQPDADPILRALGGGSVSIDELLITVSMSADELTARLSELELEGKVQATLLGYQRVAH